MPRKKRTLGLILVAIAYISFATAAWTGEAQNSTARPREKGWWIVVGSFAAANTPGMAAEFQAVNDALARCGLRTFNDFSNKFVGFRSGFNVFVVGPYRNRGDAKHTLRVAKKCAPGAYLKYREYAGE
jgi:hypothetical protein